MHFTLCDYLLDISQNSVEADASEVTVSWDEAGGTIEMRVVDNGKGMDEETLLKALDPFYTEPGKHSARKAGFGLSFLKQATELCEGNFSIESTKGEGTTVEFSFSKESVDTPPIGDIPSTVLSLMTMAGEYNLSFNRVNTNGEYSISRNDLLDALGELETVSSLSLAKDFLNSQEETLI